MNIERFLATNQRVLLAALFLTFSLPPSLFSQTNAPRDLSSRYLLIVDKSAAMKRCASGTEKTLETLLRSSLNGQLRAGDTLGVWTFDEELHTGRFPLQNWSPEKAAAITSNTVAFLRSQPNQKPSRYEVVAPTLAQVVKDSRRLTVVLVSDGDEKISGTPYDAKIQETFSQNFKAQQKARMPIITVLRASRGQFRIASVNLPPWPVEFPDFPPEPEVVETPQPKPPEKKPAPPPIASPAKAPPLVVRGEKTAPAPVMNAPGIEQPKLTETAPTSNDGPLKIETADSSSKPASVSMAAAPNEGKASPAASLTPIVGEIVTARAPTSDKTTPLVAPAASKPSPAPGEAPAKKPAALPPTRSADESAPASVGQAAPSPAPENSLARERATTNASSPVTLAVQPEPGFSRLGLAGIGTAILLLVGGFYFVFQRRTRDTARASLITRSLNQDPK